VPPQVRQVCSLTGFTRAGSCQAVRCSREAGLLAAAARRIWTVIQMAAASMAPEPMPIAVSLTTSRNALKRRARETAEVSTVTKARIHLSREVEAGCLWLEVHLACS
jgi:hypothetical protein